MRQMLERLGYSEAFDRSAPETRAKARERAALFTLIAGVYAVSIGPKMAIAWWSCCMAVEAFLWVLTMPRVAAGGRTRALRLFGSFLASGCWAGAAVIQWGAGDTSNQLSGLALLAGILMYSVRSCHRFPVLFLACAIPPTAALVHFAMDYANSSSALLQVASAFTILVLFAFISAADAFRGHVVFEKTRAGSESQQRAAEGASQNLQTVLDTLPEGVVLLDAERRYVVWNKRYAHMFRGAAMKIEAGVKIEDVLRASVARGDYPAAVGREDEWIAERMSQLGSGERHEQQQKEGTWLLVEDRPTPDGGVVGVRIDITEMKRQRQEIERLAATRETAIAALQQGLARLSAGDLSSTLTGEFAEEYQPLRADFDRAVASLRATFADITDLAGHVGDEAGDMSEAADRLARRTERQAATLEETAAGLNSVTAGVGQAAADARRIRDAAAETFELSSQSEAVVQAAVGSMAAIRNASAEVGGVCELIEAIALQTRLLALNASIEASRAGDSGRGFALIAQEVRALAERTADAAKRIQDLAAASMHDVNEGAARVEQTRAAFQAIMEQVSGINGLVKDMSVAAAEQAAGLEELNQAVLDMDGMTQENAAMVDQTTQASRALAEDAGRLSAALLKFKLGEMAPDHEAEPVRLRA